MQLTDVVVRPLLSEKANTLSDKLGKYVFRVHVKANKIEIKNAIQVLYNVKVMGVNTLKMPAKARSRYTKKGVLRGRRSAYKKALVVLAEGNTIDIYS